MAHAVVVQVIIDPDSNREHRREILSDNVVPEVQALPGFLKASWLYDGGSLGTCIAVFDSEESAQAAVGPLTPTNGPAVISAVVHAVEIEA